MELRITVKAYLDRDLPSKVVLFLVTFTVYLIAVLDE